MLPLPASGWSVERAPVPVTSPSAVIDFAARYGTVSCRDGGAAWPVRATERTGTFSVTDAAASLHTDAAYRPDPEDAFVLACVRPARVGGDSTLLAVTDLVATLSELENWPRLRAALEAPVWRWRTPVIFDGAPLSPSVPALTWDPDGSPRLRWRTDNLIAGRNIRQVANTVAQIAETHPARRVLRLEAGDVLVCNNTTMLHGRTAFHDPDRLLWRVRVHR